MKQKTHEIRQYLLNLQASICEALEAIDQSSVFLKDAWHREKGGDGVSCILEGGNVFERAGVNFSHVFGDQLPAAATVKRPEIAGSAFEAIGVSLVFHPRNPYVPTAHANVRFFIAYPKSAEPVWWFGGGVDLTPYYPFWEDCVHWHTVAKASCDSFGANVYSKLKKQCDEYFYLPHRGEARGVGGLFFDDLNEWGFDKCFAFMQSVGDNLLPGYLPIVNKRKDHVFGEAQREFQLLRRGRYVEFNLLYDRGTKFGTQFGGRTESILMSLPLAATWRYDWVPAVDSVEAILYRDYLRPRDWLALETGKT